MTKSERVLSRWGLLMLGDRGPIFAGCEGREGYRTSTPLVAFDPETLTGVTASGRPYRLVGPSEPGYALQALHSLWNTEGVVVRLVSVEEAAQLAQRNAPFDHSPEEQARLDRLKIEHCSGEIVRHMRLHGLDEPEAAKRSGLSLAKLQALLEWDTARITADEADRALVTLLGTAYGWVSPDTGERFEIFGSGSVWEDLGIPDPEEGEDDDGPAGPDEVRKP